MADDMAGAATARPAPSGAAGADRGEGLAGPARRRATGLLDTGLTGTGLLGTALRWLVAQLVVLSLGAVLGIYGALLVPAGPRVDGTLLSLGAAIALVGNLVVPRLAIRAAGRNAGITAVAGWLAAALLLSTRGAGGGVILPGSGTLADDSIAYLVLGALAGSLAALVHTGAPRTRRRTPARPETVTQ